MDIFGLPFSLHSGTRSVIRSVMNDEVCQLCWQSDSGAGTVPVYQLSLPSSLQIESMTQSNSLIDNFRTLFKLELEFDSSLRFSPLIVVSCDFLVYPTVLIQRAFLTGSSAPVKHLYFTATAFSLLYFNFGKQTDLYLVSHVFGML